MKLACASTAFNRHLAGGDLTQLEWLDLCGRELAVDGVVCDVRHFPRRDSDYLAQVKKMAVDLGLTVAAVACEEFFYAEDADMRDALAIADVIGAPIVVAALQSETKMTWPAQLERINVATALAKTMNVTLAVRNQPQTFAASSHDLKRVSKEADSAWLRYALEFGSFDGASDIEVLLSKAVLFWHTHQTGEVESEESPAVSRMLDRAQTFRGFLVIDLAGGSAEPATIKNAVQKWRTLIAEDILGESL